MKIIGIDPGLKGGLAVIEDSKVIEVCVMPVYEQDNGKNIIDIKLVSEFIKRHNPNKIYLEKVGAMKQQGVSSMFNFGVSYGALRACAIVLNYDLEVVTPQKWKKTVLGEEYDHTEKDGTIKFCMKQFPETNLLATKRSKIAHDGICDALCIGYYHFMKKDLENES